MQIERDTLVPGPLERAFALVDDLSAYPAWMDLVHEVHEVQEVADQGAKDQGVEDKGVEGQQVSGQGVSGRPRVWEVELQAQVGPFARSKRLRMVRTVHDPDRRVVFERAEVDGRRHSTWILAATLEPVSRPESHGERGTRLTMTLTYGGNLWTGAVLQRVLDDHVERGADALCALLTDAGDADETRGPAPE